MRLLLFSPLLFGLAVSAAAQSTSCGPDLNSQADVNDAASCTSAIMLRISGADIVSLAPLSGIRTVRYDLVVANNPNLESLDGLEGLRAVTGWQVPEPGGPFIPGNLIIRDNDALTDLSALSGLETASSVSVIGNGALESLDGLDALSSSRRVIIEGNHSLNDLSGIGDVSSISGLTLSDNTRLQDLAALGALTEARNVAIVENASLASLQGLEGLTRVTNSLIIRGNRALASVQALENLTAVGDLVIEETRVLVGLDGLHSLTDVTGSLSIVDNQTLVQIDALSGIASVGEDLTVEGNGWLARCVPGIGPILSADADGSAIGGAITIGSNAPGGDCNSADAIVDAYVAIDVDEPFGAQSAALAAYPNPAAVPATLAFALAQPAAATLVVYDALGREVARPLDGPASGEVTARLPALPAGLYVARLTTGDGRDESVRLTVLR